LIRFAEFPKTTAAMLLAIAAFAVAALASGARYLEFELPGGLPLGNALAALGLCAAAGAAMPLARPGTVLRAAAWASLIAAAAWLPISIALAGNLALNFGGGRGQAWLVLSVGVLVLVFAVLAWTLVAALLAIRKTAG
jgi:hypothetical protein